MRIFEYWPNLNWHLLSFYDQRNKQSWEIEQTKHSLWVKPPIKLCWDYWSKRPKSQRTHSFHLSSWSWEFQSNWETGWVVTLCWGSWPFDTAKSVLSKLVFGISLAFDSAGGYVGRTSHTEWGAVNQTQLVKLIHPQLFYFMAMKESLWIQIERNEWKEKRKKTQYSQWN